MKQEDEGGDNKLRGDVIQKPPCSVDNNRVDLKTPGSYCVLLPKFEFSRLFYLYYEDLTKRCWKTILLCPVQ